MKNSFYRHWINSNFLFKKKFFLIYRMICKKLLLLFLYNKATCKKTKDLNNMTVPIKKREAQLVHALILIFLEYFSWGLLTVPVINVRLKNFLVILLIELN